ncbi:MAG: hypothetical protein WCB19_01415 [Thermoplasmata archaeon]
MSWSDTLTTHSGPYTNSSTGSTNQPINSTETDFSIFNWTATTESPTIVLGSGANVPCPSTLLSVLGHSVGGCTGCPVAPATPAGVGERSQIPSQFGSGYGPAPLASVALNATYPQSPLATFSWSSTGNGIIVGNVRNFSSFMGLTESFYENGAFVGLGLRVQLSEIQFEVPIHLQRGTLESVPASIPSAIPTASLVIHLIYVFPASVDQGTWDMYLAGGGTPDPVGGFLFEQIASS